MTVMTHGDLTHWSHMSLSLLLLLLLACARCCFRELNFRIFEL